MRKALIKTNGLSTATTMIIITTPRCRFRQSVEIELPSPDMAIDPRAHLHDDPFYITSRHHNFMFECIYHDNGATVTLVRTTGAGIESIDAQFDLRVYDPAVEIVPDFTSTIYTYMGLDRERAPLDTTVLLIHPSVKIIKDTAFRGRSKIKKCFMYDGVHTIEEHAFYGCIDMKVIRLSRNLKTIKYCAFFGCKSLEAIFLPSCIEKVEEFTFHGCENVRVLSLPHSIGISQLGSKFLWQCHTFFHVTQIQPYEYQHQYRRWNNDEVHTAMIQFCPNLPPLHKTCLDTNVGAPSILDAIAMNGPPVVSAKDHNGMTPLHILAMNPHADVESIIACFDANSSAILVRDDRDNTALDYLMEYGKLEVHTAIITSLCVHCAASLKNTN